MERYERIARPSGVTNPAEKPKLWAACVAYPSEHIFLDFQD